MLFSKTKNTKSGKCNVGLADNSDIERIISKMNYWQSVNLMMSAWLLENPEGTKEDAYNYAITEALDNDNLRYSLSKIINFGPL